jgi:predicted nucleic acid-binding protein
MPKRIVIDSGPLIALFDKDDQYHHQALEFIRKLKGELITNYAVLTEVSHLLDFSTRVQIDFLRWVFDGGVSVVDIITDDLARIIELTEKYSDLPMDFADASLVVLCERMAIRDIASIDKDFGVYRTRDRVAFRNLFLNEFKE